MEKSLIFDWSLVESTVPGMPGDLEAFPGEEKNGPFQANSLLADLTNLLSLLEEKLTGLYYE